LKVNQLLINSYFENLDPKNRFVLSSDGKIWRGNVYH
jgi:hypothetical protein